MSRINRSVKTAAHASISNELKDGLIDKPSSCSICNITPKKLNGHRNQRRPV